VRTTIILGSIALFAFMPVFATGQTAGSSVAAIDAVAVSPDRFKVLLENEHVRVIEYVLLPGERDQWHTHPPKVSYVVSEGTLRITTADGQSFLSDEKAGTATWMETVGRHFAPNVGKTPVRIVLIEIKTTP
jgi:quercetin dioxygenase-like cupin family protein